MTLTDDGVELWKEVIPLSTLGPVVKEYEATKPDLTEVPKHEPLVGFWTYTPGSHKSLKRLIEMPFMMEFSYYIAEKIRHKASGEMRLLETIVFSKPPEISNKLGWHQDVAYFPFEPNNQLAVWIPFDKVTKDSGAMIYAIGSHKLGLRASTDLHTGEVFVGDDRPLIDVEGLETRCMEMEPGDMLVHDGRTWHTSGPNTVLGRQRRGLSFRFLVGETFYKPRAGSSATFLKQTRDINPGDKISDPAFPVV